MKSIFTLALIALSLACFGQPPKEKAKQVITFSAYEKGELADFDTNQRQLIKIFRAQDSLKAVFLQKFLIRNGVDLSRLSQHTDSLSIKPDGIEFILKPKKQK